MKKIFFKILTIVLVAGAFASCDDELDQIPFDSFATDNAFNTSADFENAIRGAYSALNGGSYYGGQFLSLPDVLTDNVNLAQAGRNTQINDFRWQYNASDAFRGFYRSTYTVAFRANQILERIDGFDGPSKDNIIAEALFLRSLAHFDNVRMFGKIPTQDGGANQSLGAVYRLDTNPVDILPRESVAFVYDKIIEDLQTAYDLKNNEEIPGRVSKDGIAVLLSRALLFAGRYDEAATVAATVSASKIAPRDSFIGLWEDENQNGLLFYIPNEPDGLGNNIGVQWSQGSATSLIPEYVISFELLNLYEDDDIRKAAYVFDATTPGGDNVNAIKKLLGRTGQTNGLVDIKILRAAEAYLNLAEALFESGSETAARAALDEVRSRRYESFTGGETGNALREAIRLERRLEFAFESQRFTDIKRWGESIVRENDGDLADGSGTPPEVLVLPAGDFRFQLPIDQGSLIVNPNLQQNPNY